MKRARGDKPNWPSRLGRSLYAIAFLAFVTLETLHAHFMSMGTEKADPSTGHVVSQGWWHTSRVAFITHPQAVLCWSLIGITLLSFMFGFLVSNIDGIQPDVGDSESNKHDRN